MIAAFTNQVSGEPGAAHDAMYAIENVNAYNVDVASPVDVQEFWEKHGELPGFAVGA